MLTLLTHIRRRWTADEDAARRYGWTIEHGRFGSVTVRDPRFDELDECNDCLGSGHCPITGEPESCLTCNGTGVVRDALVEERSG
jgi:DnaJ-class molecular chaperone